MLYRTRPGTGASCSMPAGNASALASRCSSCHDTGNIFLKSDAAMTMDP